VGSILIRGDVLPPPFFRRACSTRRMLSVAVGSAARRSPRCSPTFILLGRSSRGVWPTNGPGTRRRYHGDGTLLSPSGDPGIPALKHRDPAHQRLHRHHGAPRAGRAGNAACRSPSGLAADLLASASLFVGLQGARVRRGLPRARACGSPTGYLRLDVLHAHRLPRPARDGGRDSWLTGHLALRVLRGHFNRHPGISPSRRSPGTGQLSSTWLWLRPVHLCLLAVAAAAPLFTDAGGDRCRTAGGRGRDQPQVPRPASTGKTATSDTADAEWLEGSRRQLCAGTCSPPPSEIVIRVIGENATPSARVEFIHCTMPTATPSLPAPGSGACRISAKCFPGRNRNRS